MNTVGGNLLFLFIVILRTFADTNNIDYYLAFVGFPFARTMMNRHINSKGCFSTSVSTLERSHHGHSVYFAIKG